MALVRQPRVGDQVCGRHGTVTPDTAGPVPTCPDCGNMLLIVGRGPLGLTYTEPSPSHCPAGHALGPNKVLVSFTSCDCAGDPHRGHRTWQCRTCDVVMSHGSPK